MSLNQYRCYRCYRSIHWSDMELQRMEPPKRWNQNAKMGPKKQCFLQLCLRELRGMEASAKNRDMMKPWHLGQRYSLLSYCYSWCMLMLESQDWHSVIACEISSVWRRMTISNHQWRLNPWLGDLDPLSPTGWKKTHFFSEKKNAFFLFFFMIRFTIFHRFIKQFFINITRSLTYITIRNGYY